MGFNDDLLRQLSRVLAFIKRSIITGYPFKVPAIPDYTFPQLLKDSVT